MSSIVTVYMCLTVGSYTGAWVTYCWTHLHSSHQKPIVPQLGIGIEKFLSHLRWIFGSINLSRVLCFVNILFQPLCRALLLSFLLLRVNFLYYSQSVFQNSIFSSSGKKKCSFYLSKSSLLLINLVIDEGKYTADIFTAQHIIKSYTSLETTTFYLLVRI